MSALPTDDPWIRRENSEASGYRRLVGYWLSEWRDGHAVLELDLTPQHLNRGKILHGGVIASVIDNACGYAATWSPPDTPERLCVTLSLAVSFTGQVSRGRLRAVGHVKGGGLRIVFCAAEVFDEGGNLIAFGEGSFRYHAGSERSSTQS